ncbi:MAG: hypothetical protein ACYS5V_07490 [Planctomycetota bacterium]|jgi:vacuolar-type H+-ATPase subunit I/STV1
MNDTPSEPDEKLEDMLRRWGADQAAREAQWSARPVPVAAASGGWLRTVAVAAVTGVVAILATLYAGEKLHDRRVAAATRQAQKRIDELAGELDTARGEIESVRGTRDEALATLEGKLANEKIERSAEVAALNAALKEARGDAAKEVSRLTEQTRQLDQQLKAEQARLAAASGELADVSRRLQTVTDSLSTNQQALAALKAEAAKSADQISDMRKHLNAAGSELMLVNEKYEKEAAARIRAEQEVARLQGELARVGSGGGPEPGPAQGPAALSESALPWSGRKQVRVGRLRPAVSDAPAGQLMDRLEVLLTRLELLDVGDPRAVRAFVTLLRSAKVSAEIDSILASTQLPTSVRSWLLEARALLAEDHRVG